MAALAESIVPFSHFDQLREARDILRLEANALHDVSQRLDAGFCSAVDHILTCQGAVIVTGMGKAGLIGQKLVATFSSTGTRAHFLHPAEAVHGDLGCIHCDDVILALSNSGETEEITRILPFIAANKLPLIAITATEHSTLAQQASALITLGRLREAGPHGLAPSTTTTAMLAVGDALALVVSRLKGLTPQRFATLHPAGSLGRKLKCVVDTMRPADQIRIACSSATVREAFTSQSQPGRRSGALLLVDEDGRLDGIFTDSDLARLLEHRREDAFDQPIGDVMTRTPLTLSCNASLADVVDLLSVRKISELPIVDEEGRPVGMIDITDVISWMPVAG
ncbi:MAG TPA: KpsF/GutQ family sugar-phosphate isomerase [Caulifigura sp.]|nr:KpsF/GutQ family sugar-phosphate isomerase [Caulifigura sp.]